MNYIVSRIISGVNEQNSIVKNGCADDWTAKRAIIASNEFQVLNLVCILLLGFYNFLWLLLMLLIFTILT